MNEGLWEEFIKKATNTEMSQNIDAVSQAFTVGKNEMTVF